MTSDENHRDTYLKTMSNTIREVAKQYGFKVVNHSNILLFAEFDEEKLYLECSSHGNGLKLLRHRFLAPERFKDKVVSLQWVLDFMCYRRQKFDEQHWTQRIEQEKKNAKIIAANESDMLTEYDELDAEIAGMLGYSPQSSLVPRFGGSGSTRASKTTTEESWGDDWKQEDWESYILGPDLEDGTWNDEH